MKLVSKWNTVETVWKQTPLTLHYFSSGLCLRASGQTESSLQHKRQMVDMWSCPQQQEKKEKDFYFFHIYYPACPAH